MPNLETHVPVDADLQTIWRVLLDRIENPQRYLSGVESCSFPESEEDYAIREVIIGGVPLRERITIDERQGEVRYQLIDHPLFTGDVYNALIPPASDDPKATPIVQFRMDWQPVNETAQALEVEISDTMKSSMEDAVRYVKEMAEHLDKQVAQA
jgi:hypothetical protein